MSSHLYKPAYATRLGNHTAKSVLVRICDQANDSDGIGWPSRDRIAVDTETNRRTVDRLIQVFVAMGLLKLFEMEVNDRFGRRRVDAMQVNLARLGGDLTEEFAQAHAAAQGKVVARVNGRPCLRDRKAVSETKAAVSETEATVSETKTTVSETEPPHPLNGRTLFEPSPEPALNSRACEAGLTAEQQQDLDRLAAEGKSDAARQWRSYYAEQNAEVAKAKAEEAARDAAMRAEYSEDLETAMQRMRKRCGFAWSEGDELGPVLRQVFLDQRELDKPVWRTAAQMVSAWELQRRQGKRLRARYGPLKFFRDGHWLDPDGWHWNTEVLAMDGANAGSVE